ncbi:mannose-1-phosphate guanylyltransferase [Brumimicrobium aurantiacum]|uniref:mannose-1-phosphate guanylyltransferase n=1 Tax=Brumimicrobium aurantiacum TaxID=1737063 RepID=A0A3E1EVK2_9FLAO|nr:mannose-1-phosphate guanylyltransferase [Brumimicrobium aurantiacum]RFC53596.1 mannose-1-phosphate guanylyltransferase [Brumimicrobium aurantiacum]
MKENNYAVIMAGGVGSRFWPMSVNECPKQFLDVLGIGKTLIQLTYERLTKIVPDENIYIVTNESYVELVKTQLPKLKSNQILTEPERKNTAPCITFAAAKIYSQNKDANLIVAPSDHLILKEEKFERIISTALERSDRENRILTLGIKPTRPDTGYGYIQFHMEGDIIAGQISKVRQFTEKPNREMAEIFLKSGDYYWNSGIFVWKAATILNAIQKFKPDLHELFCGELEIYNTPGEFEFVNEAFRKCEDISIDFAVMENAKNVDVILADFDWSDLGTWGSLFDHLDKDVNGNSIKGENTHIFKSSNCLINLPDDKLAIIQGLDNHIVVESENRLLILDKKDEQSLKTYLKAIQES